MAVKSQKDVIEATKLSKAHKENEIRQKHTKTDVQPIQPVDLADTNNKHEQRLVDIEQYLYTVGPKLKQAQMYADRIETLEISVAALHIEIAKINEDLAKILEFVTIANDNIAILFNQLNELNTAIPPYVESAIDEYFNKDVDPVDVVPDLSEK